MHLHRVEPLHHPPPRIITELHSWQLSGAAKLCHLAHGPFKGGILGDYMGLGKTLAAITACEELSATTAGAFNLVITTKACLPQWQDELSRNFHPVSWCDASTVDQTVRLTAV